MAANGKMKHKCPALPSSFSVKVTGPGMTPGMSDADAKALAQARTRLFASSPIIRQTPRNTIGESKAKRSKKG